MKNLLIYINPSKDFDEEGKIAIKIQIDNSLDLGWKKENIMLVTNFEYEHNGIKSLVIGDENFCPFCPAASKINAILDLFKRKIMKPPDLTIGVSSPRALLGAKSLRSETSSQFSRRGIEKGEIYWFHDLDAYQLTEIIESELGLDQADILLSDFGRRPEWNTASFFFKDSSRDIFKLTKKTMDKYKIDEEKAFCILTGVVYRRGDPKEWLKQYPPVKNINQRIKRANITYDFHSFNVRSNYANAIKPIRVAHFHFSRPLNPRNPRPDQLDFFLRGKNKLGIQIVPQRLVKIFNQHGII